MPSADEYHDDGLGMVESPEVIHFVGLRLVHK